MILALGKAFKKQIQYVVEEDNPIILTKQIRNVQFMSQEKPKPYFNYSFN